MGKCTMARKTPFERKRRSQSSWAKSQQMLRRRKTLWKKAFEYCIECDSDIYMILCTRRNGHIYALNSNPTKNWALSRQYLVRQDAFWTLITLLLRAQDTYYPRPVYKTLKDLESEFKYDSGDFLAH
jgi:hypothetical protein